VSTEPTAGPTESFTVELRLLVEVPAHLVPEDFEMPKRFSDLPDDLYEAIVAQLPDVPGVELQAISDSQGQLSGE
jgi:hypothetical protein